MTKRLLIPAMEFLETRVEDWQLIDPEVAKREPDLSKTVELLVYQRNYLLKLLKLGHW